MSEVCESGFQGRELPCSDIIRWAKLAVSEGSIIKQVKGTGSKIPVPKTQQPAEPTAMQVSEVYGSGVRLQALESASRSNFYETPMNTGVFRVSILWVRLKKGDFNKWNKQTAQKT